LEKGELLLSEGVRFIFEELSDSEGIAFVGFSFSEGELSEVENEDGVDESAVKVLGMEKREKIEMVRTRGLHADKEVIPIGAMRGKRGDEVLESIRRHCERQGEEVLSLVINQSGMERRFRDIHTTKKSKHCGTSRCIILDEAERASRSILHSDKGSETQSTDEDTGRQVTDSFKDSRTQELCSSPASFLYHTKYIDLIFSKILCRRSYE
jgi:hypothetical protein